MLNNIVGTAEFCVYHLLIVIASRVSSIPVKGWAKRHDELLRRYLGAMTEIRTLRTELIKARKESKYSPMPLRLRCAQALAYVFTRGDRIYHKSFMSTTRATAINWTHKFRHPFRYRKKKAAGGRPKVTEEIVEMIITFKKNNGHWGAKRIRDELLKLGIIKLSKTTIANILKEHGFDPTKKGSKWEQWKGEYNNHMWGIDFFFVETVKHITCMVCVIVDVYTKEILALRVHEGRENIDTFWSAGTISQVMAEQKRQPENLIHDRDKLFLGQVTRLCAVADIKELKSPPRYATMNAFTERTIQSVKFELTHHVKAKDASDLQNLMDDYKTWFNNHRPHQSIGGLTPKDFAEGKKHPEPISLDKLRNKKLEKVTFAQGLLHTYQLVDDLKKAA